MQLSGVRRPSVCLSVCPIRPQHAAAVGLLLCVRQPGEIDRLLHGWLAGGQQQQRRSTARSSRGSRLHTDLLIDITIRTEPTKK